MIEAATTPGFRPRKSHLAFLQTMHGMGAELPVEDLVLLRDEGVLSSSVINPLIEKAKNVDVVAAEALDRYVLTKEEYNTRCRAFEMKWAGKEIQREDWKTNEPAEFSPGFVRFINSHFRRFCDLEAYEPFYLYMKQADDWLATPLEDITKMDAYQRKQFRRREFQRCRSNTLYALNRYVWVKEAALDAGEMRYYANLAHRFILYLFDDGRSVFAGKGRQMAFTTTLAAAAVIRMNFYENTHVKLIACDLDTTEEIFEDKIKYAFERLERWQKAKVKNKSGKLFRVTYEANASKTDDSGWSSKVNIVAPKVNAINGGAPNIVLIDEAAFLDIFEEMVMEAFPTIYVVDPISGKLKQKRQVWAWSTGGRSKSGNGSYEREHRDLFYKWSAGKFVGTVPVFLDWTCRAGATVEWYKNEKLRYATESIDGHTDASIEEKMITFRQHNPSSVDDMYTVGRGTLMSPVYIIQNQDRINRVKHELLPQPGRWDFHFNMSVKNPPESYFAHPVVGSYWVPYGDYDVNPPAHRFLPPPVGWMNRTFQGTDPIVHDEGLSKHASVIYDSYLCAPLATVNMRTSDPIESYIQSIGMGMAYANHGEKFCPELVESNIGKALVLYKSGPEWGGARSLVKQHQLPDYLQGGGEEIGMDTKGERKRHQITILKDFCLAHGINVMFPAFFSQLQFYIATTGKTGKTTYGVDDRRKRQDDLLDAMVFAYICRMCFQHRMPIKVTQEILRAQAIQPQYQRAIVDGKVRLIPVNTRAQRRIRGTA